MKILELGKFYPPHFGGIETLLRSFCEGFAARGAEVDCVVAHDGRGSVHEEINGVRVHRLARYGTLASTSVCPGYLSAPRRWPSDIWHHHFPNPLADLACLRGGDGTPLILTYHSDIVRQAGWLRLYGTVVRRVLDRALRVVVATPNHIDHSPWLSGIRERCEVIPFGIDLERFALPPDRRKVVEALREEGKGPVLLTIGRLVGYKGQEFLLEAARTLEARVWIVGAGPLEGELKRRASVPELRSRVRFWGAVEHERLRDLLHACDVFVLPSVTRNEAFGLAQIEAMACAKPVVSCQLPSGVPWVNQHGVTGLIAPPADSGALARAIQELLDNPAWRRELGEAGRERAFREFSQATMEDRYWELIQSTAGG